MNERSPLFTYADPEPDLTVFSNMRLQIPSGATAVQLLPNGVAFLDDKGSIIKSIRIVRDDRIEESAAEVVRPRPFGPTLQAAQQLLMERLGADGLQALEKYVCCAHSGLTAAEVAEAIERGNDRMRQQLRRGG